jgi:pimeloyl-ACP methyl ester carboxylesterase/DNA-binding CsgD family transcriptional regulator
LPPEQAIRFCPTPAGRVAYATVGSGPPLVLPALWVSHLEREWEFPEYRTFVRALAQSRTVIRYDRLGTGLSDREVVADSELETLVALVDGLGLDACSLLGMSWGATTAVAFAAQHPRRVRSLALVGGFARGEEIAPPALRSALVATVRAHWGAGARALSDVWLPGADADLRDRFARLQRAAASAEVAAATLEAIYATDVRALAATVATPALVVHRRDDHAMPHALGRELAASLQQARFVTLEGNLHLPWLGDTAAVLNALDEFLDRHDPPPMAAPAASAAVGASPPVAAPASPRTAGATPLSGREREVLRLVAEGLGDAEIAARLVVSPHTVHRHVANIRTKLGQPTRAAAAAYAARNGLI